jgi:hypothetical protein
MRCEAHRPYMTKAINNTEGTAAMFFADRAREITEFCLRRGGKCFVGWEVPTLFAYAFFHVVDRTVFLVREHGSIAAVAFAWGMPAADIQARAAAREPVFQWKRSQDNADAVFLAEVVGSQAQLGRIVRQTQTRWPDLQHRQIYTFRNGQLVGLPGDTIERLTHGRRQRT